MNSGKINVFKNILINILNVCIVINSLLFFIAFNYILILGIIEIALLISNYFLKFKKINLIDIILNSLAIVFIVLSITLNQYLLKMIMSLLLFLTIISIFIFEFIFKYKNNENHIKKIVSISCYSLSFLICVALFINACNPDILMYMTQDGFGNYPVNPVLRIENKDDLAIYHDVVYDSLYPNNTYTVYSKPNSKGIIFYIHGGGLVWGDKNNTAQMEYLNLYIKEGYSAVSIDYVLAPQNKFPQSIIQVNEALKYFVNNIYSYNLTADRIIVAGDSAGSMLAGLLCVINTNDEYSNRLGVVPALKNSDISIKGYISIAGLVDVSRFGNTGNIFVDWYFDTMARCALNDLNYATSNKTLEIGSVLHNINSNFVPTFISDGNFGTFTNQNYDLIKKLNDLDIANEYFIPDSSYGLLHHAWELDVSNPLAITNFNKTIEFINKYID